MCIRDRLYPDENDPEQLAHKKEAYEREMAFNFTEFFRVWTGDPARDFRPLPAGAQVGDFVHEADVRSFLDLISSENPESNYPYSTPEYREMFRHTLWMVPGVKEASALSRLCLLYTSRCV